MATFTTYMSFSEFQTQELEGILRVHFVCIIDKFQYKDVTSGPSDITR